MFMKANIFYGAVNSEGIIKTHTKTEVMRI